MTTEDALKAHLEIVPLVGDLDFAILGIIEDAKNGTYFDSADRIELCARREQEREWLYEHGRAFKAVIRVDKTSMICVGPNGHHWQDVGHGTDYDAALVAAVRAVASVEKGKP